MSLLLETIRLDNGKLINLTFHQKRVERSRKELFDNLPPLDLAKAIAIPKAFETGLLKCRVEYGETIHKIDFFPYRLKPVQSLKLIKDDEIDYHLKYENRMPLYLLYDKRAHADDVLIVKNGRLTDTFYCNTAFLEKGKWYTPKHPLLQGTQRDFLISKKIIEEADLTLADLSRFEKIRLFNAMITWEDAMDVEEIYT